MLILYKPFNISGAYNNIPFFISDIGNLCQHSFFLCHLARGWFHWPFFIDWLIDWLLCWVFVSVLGLSLAAASGGHSSSWCTGLSPSWSLLLGSTGSRCAGSVVVAHGPSCSAACGIFPDQGSNPCPLHYQALCHQGNPHWPFWRTNFLFHYFSVLLFYFQFYYILLFIFIIYFLLFALGLFCSSFLR